MTLTGMQREAWHRADRVLEALLELPPDARWPRLASLALDLETRRRVQRLLLALQAGDGVLDHPLWPHRPHRPDRPT